MSIKGILNELEISKDDYYRVLPVSKDEGLELYLKKQPDYCFAYNYFDVVGWQANMDKQPVFNEYKAVRNMC